MSMNAHSVIWYLQKLARALGFWGLLGLAIALLSILIGMTKLQTIAEQTKSAQLALAQQTAASIQAAQPAAAALAQEELTSQVAPDSAAAFADFYGKFQGVEHLTKQLGALNKLATQQGLVLNRGDYKVIKVKQAEKPLLQYQVVLPLKAQYIQINQFIASAMAQNPSLALTDLQFTRDNNLTPSVDARIVFTLFFKGEV